MRSLDMLSSKSFSFETSKNGNRFAKELCNVTAAPCVLLKW